MFDRAIDFRCKIYLKGCMLNNSELTLKILNFIKKYKRINLCKYC